MAIARRLSDTLDDIFLIEKNNSLAQETTSRNSEVIHAGIYYRPDSLKAKLCIKGKHLLYQYLEERNISYNRCGKFIISTDKDETESLFNIYNNALENGIEDLSYKNSTIEDYNFLDYEDYLFSPSTGIFDSHAFINSLKNDFESNGGSILLNNEFLSIEQTSKGLEILVLDKNIDQEFLISTGLVINCAGLNALPILNQLDVSHNHEIELIKGEYYIYSGKEKLENLIYPIPKKNSLGIHATIDLGNGIRFGPSAYQVDKEDYSILTDGKQDFYEEIRRYWPGIKNNLLHPGYSGIRAKIKNQDDFVIEVNQPGNCQVLSVLGYVSPGLTSSLELANYCHNKLQID